MYRSLKRKTLNANLKLKRHNLIIFTWGNVSVRDGNLIAIKPSGVSYEKMKVKDIVVVDLEGKIIDGKLKPSVDLPTHLKLYRKYPEIGSIVHTHSPYATAWAQKGRTIPVYGTTHADYFFGEIPCGRFPKEEELDNYEKNTGSIIIETLNNKDPLDIPGCILQGHGVFAWGKDSETAVHNAVVLEEIAKMAFFTETIPGENIILPGYILKKHYKRKHGKNATYGQNK